MISSKLKESIGSKLAFIKSVRETAAESAAAERQKNIDACEKFKKIALDIYNEFSDALKEMPEKDIHVCWFLTSPILSIQYHINKYNPNSASVFFDLYPHIECTSANDVVLRAWVDVVRSTGAAVYADNSAEYFKRFEDVFDMETVGNAINDELEKLADKVAKENT
jgi:hypothetical protein